MLRFNSPSDKKAMEDERADLRDPIRPIIIDQGTAVKCKKIGIPIALTCKMKL